MRRAVRLICVAVSFLFALASLAYGQGPVYKPGEYPAPVYPKISKNVTVEDLMPTARSIVKEDKPTHQHTPGYGIKPGERVILFANREQDPRILEALRRAIGEAGGTMDLIVGGRPYPGGDGLREFEYFWMFDDYIPLTTGGLDDPTQLAIALAGKYDLAISGDQGSPKIPAGSKLRWSNVPWEFVDQFLLNGIRIPDELANLIDDTTWAMMSQAVSVHATDPEGTDLTWSAQPSYWEGAHSFSHQMILGKWEAIRTTVQAGMPVGATGVLAGCWNHGGPYPCMRLTVKNNHVTKVEGGGAFGQKLRDVEAETKDVTWPTKQEPGLFGNLFEAALGTTPHSIRSKYALDHGMGNWMERLRSGVIHWGIGAGNDDGLSWSHPEEGFTQSAQYYRDHPETPTGHVHVHTYFITLVATTADGRKVTVIDKGHLTALDDPKVRQVAAKYGNPDDFLKEIWIPAIPGINVPGNYSEYAKDPAAYVRKDFANWPY